MSDSLDVSFDGPVATARLARPHKRNALDDDIRAGLAELCRELDERTDVRVLVLAGEGSSFSAGADLSGAAFATPASDPEAWHDRRHRIGAWQRVLDHLDRIPQATVARLQGHVIGGGALLAAACDLRVADRSTSVRIPELAIGIPLTWAGIPLLVREVGLPATRDWVMTGRAVDADEALRTGFVQRLVEVGELDQAVDEAIAQLVAMPAAPLAMTRAMTAAIGRTAPAALAGWADADILAWSFAEPEGRDAARDHDRRRRAGEVS